MSDEKLLITKKGLDEKKARLKELQEVIKPAALAELNLARSQGDLSENADFDAASKRTQEIENEINQIQYIIDHSTLVEETIGNTVRLGGKVKIQNLSNNDVYDLLIVGSSVLTVFVFFGITYEYIIEFFKKGDKENGVL